jgi:hypothetical protein
MKIKNKTLCDFTKSDREKYLHEMKDIIVNPKYICKKCLRASSDKTYLCKPDKI